jgi:hypothetical protein
LYLRNRMYAIDSRWNSQRWGVPLAPWQVIGCVCLGRLLVSVMLGQVREVCSQSRQKATGHSPQRLVGGECYLLRQGGGDIYACLCVVLCRLLTQVKVPGGLPLALLHPSAVVVCIH